MIFIILSTLLNVVGIVYLTSTFCEHFFPERTSIIRQQIIWNGMRYYTIVEMNVIKYTKLLDLYIKDIFPPKKKEDILFIGEGQIAKSYYYDELFKDDNNLNNKELPEYDFILYFLKVEDNEKFDYNVIRLDNHNQLLEIKNNTYTIKPSKLKILALQIKIENREGEPISINFGKYNYFMDKNILLDRQFIMYYLNTSHHIKLNDNDDYEITFVDKNMNIIQLTDEHKIEIKNNDYEIWFNVC
jgi:hypothetical protein